jgi:hypothetical protein
MIQSSAVEFYEEYLQGQKELARQIYETKDAIVLNVRCPYCIDKSQIDTPEKIIRWVVHLSEKNWMTSELIREFILVACRCANINPFGV